MTEIQPERDAAGRFTKTQAQEAPVIPETVHPASRFLFGWVQARRTPLVLLLLLVVLVGGLAVADLARSGESRVELANMTGFYGLWSAFAVAVTILLAWPLSRLLRRAANYYGEGDDTPGDAGEAD
ncbi:MAG: hypothetical protein AAGF20_08020 [Pseudomonadota bacterium]